MNKMWRRASMAGAFAVALSTTVTATATADPNGQIVTLTCDDGKTYNVALGGDGAFTPGHDVAGTTMIVVTAFGAGSGTVTDADGNVIEELSQLASVKGNASKDRAGSVTCTYTFDETTTTADGRVLHVHFEGSVVGFTTPLR